LIFVAIVVICSFIVVKVPLNFLQFLLKKNDYVT